MFSVIGKTSVLATIDNLIPVVIKYVVRVQTPRILPGGKNPPVTSTRCVSPIGGRRMRVREHQGMLQSRATEYRCESPDLSFLPASLD